MLLFRFYFWNFSARIPSLIQWYVDRSEFKILPFEKQRLKNRAKNLMYSSDYNTYFRIEIMSVFVSVFEAVLQILFRWNLLRSLNFLTG